MQAFHTLYLHVSLGALMMSLTMSIRVQLAWLDEQVQDSSAPT
jgi:hypothetical protein